MVQDKFDSPKQRQAFWQNVFINNIHSVSTLGQHNDPRASHPLGFCEFKYVTVQLMLVSLWWEETGQCSGKPKNINKFTTGSQQELDLNFQWPGLLQKCGQTETLKVLWSDFYLPHKKLKNLLVLLNVTKQEIKPKHVFFKTRFWGKIKRLFEAQALRISSQS